MPEIHYKVLAIPLNRPPVIRFLGQAPEAGRGHSLWTVGQRPTRAAETAWISSLSSAQAPAMAPLVAIDDPHGYLEQTTTDQLIPLEHLEDERYLTLNLGGWSPIYFAVVGLAKGAETAADPLLRQAEVLADYGETIRFFGADPAQVMARLESETGTPSIAELGQRLKQLQRACTAAGQGIPLIEQIYREIISGRRFADTSQPPLPILLLYDALLGEMVRLENARRRALAAGDGGQAEAIKRWQEAQAREHGLRLILKGEYVVGRARRSTVLIAPELDVVIKQPGPEPFHEIELGARIYEETEENWPFLTFDGALVTPRGRVRLIMEEDILPQIARVFGHHITFSTLMGLTIEAFLPGQTIQQQVLSQPDRLTPELYEAFVLHQQVCELLGVENGDWHSANFMIRPGDGRLVHIDWGAARPLRADELNAQGRFARLNQMKNIAFSFHNQRLAERVLYLHEALIGDSARLARIRERAQALIAAAH